MRDWLLIGAALALIVVGGFGVFVGMRSDADVAAARAWAESEPAQRAQRLAAATATPVWLPTTPPASTPRPLATAIAAPTPDVSTADSAPTPVPATQAPAAQVAHVVQVVPTESVPLPHVRVVGSDFTFLDPPEPGANVHLTVMLQNDEPNVSPALALSFRSDWFGGYHLESSSPALVADRAGRDRRRRLVLDGLPPGVTSVDLNLVSTAEGLEPPQLQLETAAGAPPGSQPGSVLGTAQPPTAAPPPRPGPVMALRIPRIGLSTAVVPTSWEPPAFIVGQLQDSAAVTLGNTVLVGHVSGFAGTVFAHLDQLEPGDDIVAISRGVEYRFAVSQTFTGAADDSSPIEVSDTPRLTLMTCTGTWEPFARSYSDRLWVIAEPQPEAAAP